MERYFKSQKMEAGGFTKMGGYWDRKGTTEIDFIVINEITKTVDFAEINKNKSKINIGKLQGNVSKITSDLGILSDYQINYNLWSVEDM